MHGGPHRLCLVHPLSLVPGQRQTHSGYLSSQRSQELPEWEGRLSQDGWFSNLTRQLPGDRV